MKPEKYKALIRSKYQEISDLNYEITALADKAMDDAGVKVPSPTYPEMNDDAQWFHIGSIWDCKGSPFGLCMYHFTDRAHDNCVFCGQPEERK